MKKQFFLFVAVLCALASTAQVAIDSVTKNWNLGTAYTHVDSGTYYQFELLSAGMVHVASSPQWVQSTNDTLPISYTFTGLDTMTHYYVAVNTFPNITGIPYSFYTDTLITMPTINRDTTIRYVSLGAARLFFNVSGGYDTSWVEVQINTNSSFTGFGNAILYHHIPWGSGSANVYFTNLPQNQLLYKRYRVRNSHYTSAWLFNAAVDTFGLWTGTVIVNPTVTTEDSVANYNSVTVTGSATLSNGLQIRYGYAQADVLGGGGYVAGFVPGSQSSLSTSVTIPVQPATPIYYRAESQTTSGIITDDVKLVTSWDFPTMQMPLIWVDTTFTTADFVFTPNSNGIAVDSFVVEIGSPTLSFLEQRFKLIWTGTFNGSQTLPFTVSNLTEGNHYQLRLTPYAFGVAVLNSSTDFTTPSHGTTQTSAANAEVTGVNNLVPAGGSATKSVVDLQVSSQNLASTGWLEINNDFDTTNFYTPLTFTLTSYNTSTASPVYVHQDVMTDDIPQDWDQYSDQFGRYIVRPVIYNSDNTGPYYGDWYYFYPRGVQTGITVPASERIKVFPNPSTDYVQVQLVKEVPVVRLMDLNGKLLAEEKNTKNAIFTTTELASGVYLINFGTKSLKITVLH